MELFLVRHAQAEEYQPGGDDARRALTAKGRKRFARAVEGLRRIDVRFERVLFSPLLRAQETADLLAPVCQGEMEVDLELAKPPGEELLAHLASASEERVALVGHEPHLSQLCAWLVFGWRVLEDAQSSASFELEKGGVAHLRGEPEPGAMTLVALHPPALLRTLGR